MTEMKNNLKTLKGLIWNPTQMSRALVDFEAYYTKLYKKLEARGYDKLDLVILEKVLGKTREEILS